MKSSALTLVYRGNQADKGSVSYRVYEGENLAAEFSYHTQCLRRDGGCRFWIDELRLSDPYSNVVTMEAVLQFIQYKCHAAGCQAMHVCLDEKNIFYTEQYRSFGFYRIDQEEREMSHGHTALVNVLKYPLPASRDEFLRSYIMRSERKRAKLPSVSS